jgi:hypothetical protein
MATPGWALFVGIVMMLIGGCGAVNSINLIRNPDTFTQLQVELETAQLELDSVVVSESKGEDSLLMAKEEAGELMLEGISEMMDISDYREEWIFRLAKYGLVFSFLYLIGGLMLMIKRPWSILLAYLALFASVLFNAFQFYIYSQDPRQGMLETFSYIPIALTLLFSIVSLIIVATSDKTAYLPKAEQEEIL